MPRLLRHKVLVFPLPNLLPVLPPSFTESAKLKHREVLRSEPNGRKKVNNGKSRPSVLPVEPEPEAAEDDPGRAGSGMDVDEIGSTVASTEMNGGNEAQPGSVRSEPILTHEQELEAALNEIPLTDLPEPDERELWDFFSNRTKEEPEARTENGLDVHQTQMTNGSSSRSVSQSAPQHSLKDKEWKDPEVFFIQETGEIFLDYEKYVERILFYKRKIFNSDNSVHNGSDTVSSFFRALEGEKENSVAAQGGLPPILKKACLRVAQFSLDGRLETLQDKVYARLQDRFFEQEKVFVELGKDSYMANVAQVIRPSSPPTSSKNGKQAVRQEPHADALDSSVTQEDADKADDPAEYRYKVQLISPQDMERNKQKSATEDTPDLWGDRVIEVGPEMISRDKIEFSKMAIKRLLRDSLTRDSVLCSPWLVHEPLARKYGIPTQIPEDVQRIAETERKVQIEKRRRTGTKEQVSEVAEEGPPSKKQKVEGGAAKTKKRRTAAQIAEDAARKAEEDRIKKEQEEEAARLDAEKKKKKPMKYPAEDYLIEYTPRDKSIGKPQIRPSFSGEIPFPMHFEAFVTTWNFLNALSKPLGLSPFTIDEYENALYHNNPNQPCILLQEIHQTLLSLIRADASTNQDLVLPLKGAVPPTTEGDSEGDSSDESEEDDDDEDEDKQEKIKLVTNQAGVLAAEFSVKETNGKVGRRDWEGMLAGCLWQRGTTHSVPNLIHYLLGLLLEAENVPTGRPTWSAASTRPKLAKNLSARYLALHSVFKLEIVAFLCELAMQTGVIRDYYDQAALALSKCRNDQNANKRELAKIRGEKPEGDAEANGETNGVEDTPSIAAKESEDSSLSEAESSSGGISRQQKVKLARQRKDLEAKQAQNDLLAATKKKKADDKARRAEKEEEERLVAQSAELTREFRRQYNSMRTYPLGQDRFLHKIWWLDGCGTADLVGAEGEPVYGTGRIYIQAPAEADVKRVIEQEELDEEEMAAKRKAEEPEGERLEPGEWAAIDTPEQLENYLAWLSEKGKREHKLLKSIGQLRSLIEAGMRKRGELYAPEPEVEEQGLTARRQKRNSGKNPYKSGESYLGYKNTYR